MTFWKPFVFLALLACGGSAFAKAPAAPTGFKVKPLGANSFLLEWTDNSNDETGWEISISLGSVQKAERFSLVNQPNLTSYAVVTNDLPGATLTFQLAAYNGSTGLENFSKRTPPVVAKALDGVTFNAPTKLVAKPLDDGRIQLTWKDWSTTEAGYHVEYRKGNGKWNVYSIWPGADFKMALPIPIPNSIAAFEPSTDYSFRVRAYKANPVRFSAYSNVVTAKTKSFLKPIDLQATAEGEGKISLKWNERSAIETGYEIEARIGTAEFSKYGDVGPNVRSIEPIKVALDSTVDFRVRAFRTLKSGKEYTGYSNISSAKSSKIYKPTNLAASAQNDGSVKLTWKDNSSREAYYLIQYRKVGATDFETAGSVAADATQYVVTNLNANTGFEFRVGSSEWFGIPSYSATAQATTKHGIVGNMNPPYIAGEGFQYRIQLSSTVNLTSVDVTGLPSGLSYDAATYRILGTALTSGTYNITLNAHYSDGSSSIRTLVLKVISGYPQFAGSFASVNVAVAATKTISLQGRISDPDTPDAVRFHTTKGDFDIILYTDSTPVTVANFLAYVNDGLYTDSFFHRAPQDFVVQGGGFRHTVAGGYVKIPTFPAIQNEPGFSNLRGEVSMARIGGQPNSATCQFFVNLGNNSSDLDGQDGGFTVFGRVTSSGLPVIDSINALPKSDYSLSVDFGEPVGTVTNLFEDVPVDSATAPATLDPAALVKVTSVELPPILTCEVTSVNPAIATATLNSAATEITITGVSAGSTTVSVKLTDLDGRSTTQSIPVTVP